MTTIADFCKMRNCFIDGELIKARELALKLKKDLINTNNYPSSYTPKSVDQEIKKIIDYTKE